MKKIAVVGAGYRCFTAFAQPLTQYYSDRVKIAGVCDTNIKRCEYFKKHLGSDIGVFTDFDEMTDKIRPDAVIITTQDCFHHEYIIRALEKGCDVYCEKPITTDEEKCFAIREAEKKYGKKVIVTFNCRFMPYFVKLKEIVASGVIGRPLAINYEYFLYTVHGGDYFKRWHRFIKNSGGMMVHKATHHFDIVNWLTEDDPVAVSAQGARLFFGDKSRAFAERCSECKKTAECPAYDDFYSDECINGLYFEAEKEDGYIRDRCAFSGDTDIYDSMSVSVSYKKGALLTYSLNLFNTEEGFNINIIGENGRIEAPMLFERPENVITVKPRGGGEKRHVVPAETGTHEGADERMLAKLFGDEKEDPLNQCAGSYDGFKSVLIGVAANKSIIGGDRIDLTPWLNRLKD